MPKQNTKQRPRNHRTVFELEDKDILCSSGGKCSGICREEHLFTRRRWIGHCPEAYRN
jgi:hypothetical protein